MNNTLIDAHKTIRQMRSFGVAGPYSMMAPLSYAEALVADMRELGIPLAPPAVGGSVDLEFSDGMQLSVHIVEHING